MNKLSTGGASNLKNYRRLCVAFFGEESAATKFIDNKISESPKGDLEEVIADERQMVLLLATLNAGKSDEHAE